MSGRARARRICQAGIGALIDPKKAAYDLVKDETGELFDRWFSDGKNPEQRLLDGILAEFATTYPDDLLDAHLTASAQTVLARHGLSRQELAGPGIRLDASKATALVCRRGVSTRPSALGDRPLAVEVDIAIEGRLRQLVQAFYEQLVKNLDNELQVAIFGRQLDLLEGIDRKLDGLTPAPEAPRPRFSIKEPVTDFQGYEAEIARLADALARGSASISAVQGIGGAGKTELARKVAREMRDDFPDGQIFVDMLGTTQPRGARDAMTDVLTALGVEDIGPDTLAAEYQSQLAGKRLLILLDNVAGQAGLDQLVPPVPAALLVTSRTRLALPGIEPVLLEKLSRPTATALLAGMVPGLTDAQTDRLAGLCADLPLALRVAGSYLQATGYSVDAYLDELQERRLARLAESGEDIGDATLNPMVVLGHSYDRLAESDAALAALFGRLGTFPADFEVAGAAAVFGLDEPAARRQLGRLVQLGLVQPPEQGRWRLHDLLRELAVVRAKAGELAEAKTRHQVHYLALLDRCANEFTNVRDEVSRALTTFEAEQPNAAAAIDQAQAVGDLQAAALAHQAVGIFASALGRREDALEATEKAVARYRELAIAQPDAFLPHLAVSLHNLGRRLDALGRRKEALKAIKAAVAINRELSVAQPDVFQPILAASLDNLGNALDALGRHEDALKATEEAVALYRELAAARPDAFRPDLDRLLSNLGGRFPSLGRREEALATTEKAVAVYRELAATRPDAFRPDLAMLLNNLGVHLHALGQREEALAATEEAVAVYRELAAARPDAFNPNLASSLYNLSLRLDAFDRFDEAQALNTKAIELLRPTFLQHPRAVIHWMASMCRQYVERCQKLGVEPDADLLGPIDEVFARLRGEGDDEA